MFESLVQDVSSRTGLGQVQANDLLRALTARLLHNSQGGFAPYLASLRDGGKGDLVAHWLGDDPKAGAISPDEAESMLGADYVDETSRALGITRDEVRIGSAVALPSVVDALTPGGMIPAADELERGYAGWAGGHLSVDEAPIAGFPKEPSSVGAGTRVDMDLARPAPAIKAKAFDGVATLLPWFALFVLLPVLSLATCNIKPEGGGEHGAEHGAVTHEEVGASPSDSPAHQPAGGTAESGAAPSGMQGGPSITPPPLAGTSPSVTPPPPAGTSPSVTPPPPVSEPANTP